MPARRVILLPALLSAALSHAGQAAAVFRDATADRGLAIDNGAACWADLTNDGWVDLCAGSVWINDKGTHFTKLADGIGRAVAADFDNDGFADLFSWSSLKAYRNDAGRSFASVPLPELPRCVSRGACWGDFDGDGLPDLFAGNFAHVDGRGDQPKSRFLRNLGPGKEHAFEDLGPCGIRYQESYASPAAGDYDNDGDLDLYFTTVYGVASFGRKNFPVLFRNDGGFAFADATAAANLSAQPPTYQAAWADYDRDGDLDLVTAGKLFENRGAGGRWLEVHLAGDGRVVNRSAIGAQARITIGKRTLMRQVEAGTGEGNQNDLVLHFGLGAHTAPVTLEILWPKGRIETAGPVETNRLVARRFAP